MFGVQEQISLTDDLKEEYNANREQFRKIADDCIAIGSRRVDCEKCEAGEDHLEHATEEERLKSQKAYIKLFGREDTTVPGEPK